MGAWRLERRMWPILRRWQRRVGRCARVFWRHILTRVGERVRTHEPRFASCIRSIADNANRQSASMLSACAISGISLARSGHALVHFGADRSGSGCRQFDDAYRLRCSAGPGSARICIGVSDRCRLRHATSVLLAAWNTGLNQVSPLSVLHDSGESEFTQHQRGRRPRRYAKMSNWSSCEVRPPIQTAQLAKTTWGTQT